MSFDLTIKATGMNPAPKGSLKGFAIKNKFTGKHRAVLVEDNKKTKPFRGLLTARAIEAAAAADWKADDSPIGVTVYFYTLRPKSVKRAMHSTKPDIDKLLRTVFDALQDARIFPDDSRVVELTSKKFYCTNPDDAGCVVYISKIDDSESM